MAAGSFYGPPGGGGAPSFYGPPGGAGAGAPSFYGPPGGGGASPSFYGPSSSGPSHWGDMSFQAGPTTIFKITASARNLPKMDGLLGKADPYVVVNTPAAGPAKPKKAIVKTEVIRNDLNPTWKPFEIDAAEAGGETTPLLWELYDWDADGSHDFIGSFTASLQQIASQPRFQILNPNRKSTFGRAKPESGDFHVIKVERETRAPKALPQAIRFVFRGEKLAKKDLLTSDPFLVFWATPLPSASGLPQDQVAALQQQVDGRPAGTPRVQVIIAKTEVIQSNLNPTWQPIEIPLELTGGMDAKMTVICWDFDDDGTHDEIGRTVVSLRDLIQKDPMIPLIDPAKKGGLTYTNSGLLRVSHFEEIPQGPPVPKPLAFDLSISCSKLARMDATGKSDPFLQISARIPLKQKEGKAVIYKSEVLHQTLSGTFRPFQLTVVDCGGLDNPLTFSVYDKDDRGQELIGAFKTTLRELSFQKANIHHLVNPAHKLSSYSGIIKVTSCSPSFTITPTGVLAPAYRIQAAGKAMFRTSNVFTVYAGTKAGPVLYRSQAVANNKNPVFDAFVIETQKAGGLDGPLYFEFSDPSPGTKSPFVGQFTSSLRELNMFRTSPLIPIIDPAQDGRVGYRSSGDFEIQHVEPLVDPAPPAWGAPPPGQWGAPPGGYGGPPAASQWGAPPGGYGGPPAASQWGPPPGGAPPGGYGGPPAASQWGPPPGGAPPGGYGGPPAASQWGPPPGGAPPGGYGGPPAASQWGAPPGGAPPGGAPPGGYGGPPAASQWGPPPGGAPPSGYGGPPAASQWGPPPGGAPPGGAPPAGGAPAGGAPPGGAPPPAASQWGPPPGGAPPGGYYGAPPSDGGYGAPPGGYGAPPGGYGGPPAASQWGPPPGGSPAPSHYGAPPGGYGAPPGGSH